MSETEQPVFSIEKIYVKDLSLELPNAPQIFLERDQPAVEVGLQSEANGLGDGIFEVVLTVTVTARVGEKTQFLVEAAQAGIFQIRNVPDEEIEPVLAIACPNILFPYARESVSDTITRAGFQPVILAPVNFESLYRQRLEQQASQPTELPIQ
ncbi:MAG: protein-export chaperone SecB [Burkholderiales bacterium]|jgi:preprotein translocase subunit SecB|uniref:Protein-export protein SecB n=1 Tax=Candidatus Desulfobacillus denitrificans TaxID=2608985 RepID=A0A809QWF5_9PROT|nr:protein-export chaperone SecB [Zoogloeaceae bacterium]MBP9654701.1 protein-export chaperone SecB [Rhodocyclaceae bacterium]MCZ2173858.1 protein-export chaperone SecB [Burkholderiales bacterium]OQY67854.1 MAG: protein-export chaperone SecB [Rhodocyclaceae bacterium UTPRO2]BBO19770.1 protein-export chaperone SecB [Candidatus Desulfobacillus denitrificans]GIK45917.1 MAG: protein-export protein SecB [Betaproteobacteria bacterium]